MDSVHTLAIVCIDDEPHIVSCLSRSIRSFSRNNPNTVHVFGGSTPNEIIKKINAHEGHIIVVGIFCDYALERGLTGPAAVNTFLELLPDEALSLRNVVFMSGSDRGDLSSKVTPPPGVSLELTYMDKPFDMVQLKNIVNQMAQSG